MVNLIREGKMSLHYMVICVECDVRNEELIRNSLSEDPNEDALKFIDFHSQKKGHSVQIVYCDCSCGYEVYGRNDCICVHKKYCDKYKEK